MKKPHIDESRHASTVHSVDRTYHYIPSARIGRLIPMWKWLPDNRLQTAVAHVYMPRKLFHMYSVSRPPPDSLLMG